MLTKADKEHEEYVWSIVGWYVHGLVYLDSPAPSPSDIPNLNKDKLFLIVNVIISA
jgi:hypothetical protein